MSKEYPFDQSFDPNRKLQYINSDPSVMHCHHYSAIFTKLALELQDSGGARYLTEAMEEASYIALRKVFITEGVQSAAERRAFVEQYYRLTGLGDFSIRECTANGGSITLRRSHIDEGWVKKYGQSPVPVNFVTAGFLAGAFAAIHDEHLRHYQAEETASMASGKAAGEFIVKVRS
jgi:hypothetical protein